MIMSWQHWSKTLGLSALMAIASSLITLPAWAIPKDQIVAKLNAVPVFTIVNDKGQAVTRFFEKENKYVAGIFISQADAQNYIKTNLTQEKPDLAKSAQIVLTSLGEVYQEIDKKENQDLLFEFIPEETEVKSAVSLLQQSDKNVKEFRGVPLYFVAIKDGDMERYLPHPDGTIRLYFDQADISAQLDDLKKQLKDQPDLVKRLSLKVVPLEGLLAVLQEENDESLQKMMLVPTGDSLKLVESILKEAPQPPAPNTPKPPTTSTPSTNTPKPPKP